MVHLQQAAASLFPLVGLLVVGEAWAELQVAVAAEVALVDGHLLAAHRRDVVSSAVLVERRAALAAR